MHRWIVLIAFVFAIASHPVKVAAQDAVHVIPEFTFEGGDKLAEMKVGYATYGRLNDAKSNALLVTHGASGLRTSNAPLIGPGKAYDTDKYFVITVDAIGGGNSSQPKDGLGPKFPKYTIRDMVRAQHDLLTKGWPHSRARYRWSFNGRRARSRMGYPLSRVHGRLASYCACVKKRSARTGHLDESRLQ